MEADLSQIKIMLWILLGLQAVFISLNLLCKFIGCGERKKIDYGDLLDRGHLEDVIEKTRARLESHPRDVDALYFHAKALLASGRLEQARIEIGRLWDLEPALSRVCKEWLDAIDAREEKAG